MSVGLAACGVINGTVDSNRPIIDCSLWDLIRGVPCAIVEEASNAEKVIFISHVPLSKSIVAVVIIGNIPRSIFVGELCTESEDSLSCFPAVSY